MSSDDTTATRQRPMVRDLGAVLALAIFAPQRVWARLLVERRDATWLYGLIAIESLLMRPESSTRALWAVWRRGFSSLLSVLQLAATELIIVMLSAYALAVALRLLVPHPRERLDLGELSSVMPWVFAPKLIVTFVFAIAWAFDLVPGTAMIFAGFRTDTTWTTAYHVLAYAPVAVSFFICAHAYRSGEPTIARASLLQPLPFVLLAIACAAVVWRVDHDPRRFRPIGRGDQVTALSFAPLRDEAPVTLTFPRNRPVVIDFWASWCGPCIEALPAWQTLTRDTTLDADFVSANVDEMPETARQFLGNRGYTFPAHSADAATQARFQITTLPTTLVISSAGDIREYWVGAASPTAIKRAIVRP